jgi:hypothetical protein
MKTKERILEKSLELMNQEGYENISTHDIARALNIRQSNITYYFPTRMHIINTLAKRMIEEVDASPEGSNPDEFSLKSMYILVDYVMKVHQKYHFILLNYASIITADKELNEHYIRVLKRREPEFNYIISTLEKNSYVKKNMINNSYMILLQLNMLGIYWIQESAIYNAEKSNEAKRKHYLRIFFLSFIPYLTKRGEKDLLPLLK